MPCGPNVLDYVIKDTAAYCVLDPYDNLFKLVSGWWLYVDPYPVGACSSSFKFVRECAYKYSHFVANESNWFFHAYPTRPAGLWLLLFYDLTRYSPYADGS